MEEKQNKTYKQIAMEMVGEAMQEEAERKASGKKMLVQVCSCRRRRDTKYANNLRKLREGEFYG